MNISEVKAGVTVDQCVTVEFQEHDPVLSALKEFLGEGLGRIVRAYVSVRLTRNKLASELEKLQAELASLEAEPAFTDQEYREAIRELVPDESSDSALSLRTGDQGGIRVLVNRTRDRELDKNRQKIAFGIYEKYLAEPSRKERLVRMRAQVSDRQTQIKRLDASLGLLSVQCAPYLNRPG